MGDAFAHADQAVTASSALESGAAGPGWVIDDLDLYLVTLSGQSDVYGGAGCVFQGVGERFLHQPVGGVGAGLGEAAEIAAELAGDRQPR